MDRFQFLKTCGIALGVGVLTSKPLLANDPATPEPAVTNQRFRPGTKGQILVSRGPAEAWTQHAAFGPDFEVLSIRQERNETIARLRFQGQHDIRLQLSANGQNWLVA